VTHHRVRRFNTAGTYPEQNLSNDLSQAVVTDDGTVYLRGQIGQDIDSAGRESVGVGDAAAQADKAVANIAMLLAECGSGLDDIVKIDDRKSSRRDRRQALMLTSRTGTKASYWCAGRPDEGRPERQSERVGGRLATLIDWNGLMQQCPLDSLAEAESRSDHI